MCGVDGWLVYHEQSVVTEEALGGDRTQWMILGADVDEDEVVRRIGQPRAGPRRRGR